MIGTTISHYRILEKLGEGGMGVVYKAHDVDLDRIVALKFLPHHLTANEGERERFIQEAKAASALNHPNVCVIHGIDEHEGQKFIEMEYIDGVTLRQKISDAPLRIGDALTYAVQVGEALHEAHTKGIVHRDIKCENIMVNSRNQIKVMDFGLAKLKGSMKLTKTSSTVGTLAYMAPEQIQGGEVDARSDIFSFGVVLFEMLTARVPFRGEHEAAVMYSIVNEEPDPIERFRSDLPPSLVSLIQRMLEKDPADRYQHADDLVSELRRIQKQSAKVSRSSMEHPVARSEPRELPGAPAPEEKSASSKRQPARSMIIIAGAVVVAAVALFFSYFQNINTGSTESQPARKMLAVLPFENLGSPEQDYFADGLTEEITNRLSGLSGLGVIARSSMMQYKKTTKSLKHDGRIHGSPGSARDAFVASLGSFCFSSAD